jgi:hypothetical protein
MRSSWPICLGRRPRKNVPRREVVAEIKRGEHPSAHVVKVKGRQYARDNPDSSKSDNVNREIGTLHPHLSFPTSKSKWMNSVRRIGNRVGPGAKPPAALRPSQSGRRHDRG